MIPSLRLTKDDLFNLLNNEMVYKKEYRLEQKGNILYQYYISVGAIEIFKENKNIYYYTLTKSIIINLLKDFKWESNKYHINII